MLLSKNFRATEAFERLKLAQAKAIDLGWCLKENTDSMQQKYYVDASRKMLQGTGFAAFDLVF